MQIYLTDINNLTDARFGAAQGFWALGFNFDAQNPNYLGYETTNEITAWTTGCQLAGSFALPILELINDAVALCKLGVAELPFGFSAQELRQVRCQKMLRVLPTELPKLSAEVLAATDFLRINAPNAELLELLQVPEIQGILRQKMAFFDAKFSLNDLQKLKEMEASLPNLGLCLSAGGEQEPGIKDYEYLSQVIDALG